MSGAMETVNSSEEQFQKKIDQLEKELEKYRIMIDKNPAMICRFQPDGTLTFVNAAYCQYFQCSQEDLLKTNILATIPEQEQTSLQQLLDDFHPAMPAQTHIQQVLLPDGTRRWNKWIYHIFQEEEGRPQEFQGLGIDIHEEMEAEHQRKHTTRLYAVLSQINQTIVRVKDRDTLFREICRIMVEHGDFIMAWIGMLNPAQTSLKPVAAYGPLPEIFSTIPALVNIDKNNPLPPSRACLEKKCIADNQLEEIAHYQPWKKSLVEWGVNSIAAVPICPDEDVIGVLSILLKERQFFREAELNFLQEIGDDISFALSAMEEARRRKKVEKELTTTNNILRAVLDSPDVIIYSLDRNYCYTSFNENHRKEMKRLRQANIKVGMNFLESIPHPDERQQTLEKLNRALGGEQFTFEEKVEHPGIQPQYFENTLSPMYDATGEIVGVTVFVRDVTLRKMTERKLQQHSELIDKILNTTQDGYILADLQGQIKDVNPAYCQMVGYTREELLKKNIQEIEASMSPDEIKKRIEEFVQKGRAKFQTAHHHKNGHLIQMEVSVSMIVLENRQLVAAFIRDISDQKKILEALKASEKSYRELFDNATDAIYIQDKEGNFLDVNKGAEKMYGYPREFFIGKTPEVLSAPGKNDLTELSERIQKAFAGEPQRFEFWGLRSNGEVFPKEVRLNRGTYFGKEVVIAFAQDITERKQLEEQLLQAQKMEAIGKLAGGIAHDFNNLLTVINGYSDLLLDQIDSDHPLFSSVQQIQKAGLRAAELTAQLLAFSRRQVIQPIVMNINQVVRDTEKMLRRLIGENIELLTYLEKDLGNIKADIGQIEQIIFNLAVNARDAMPEGGKLTIETANVELDEVYSRNHLNVIPGSHVMLTVSDTGTGMTKDVQEHIFEPFFTTKGVGEGTGLGLSTVYGIVRQNNGTIWVYSEPGKGSTFKIYFPRVDAKLEQRYRREAVPEHLKGSETILLVEDDESVRKLAKEILEQNGYRVLEASDGEEALKLEAQYPESIDLILTDVIMPRMSGKELVSKIQERRSEMKVVYCSGYTDNTIVHQGVLEEGTRFIQKPFTPLTLLEIIRNTLDETAP
ncbi:MAG: PAS domain S-box protein [Calditrichaeota bacterium]|nr:MAG: PAS domain S-box protein [Calditrichota bacterium]